MFSVIFEVRPGDGRKDAYLALAKEMKPVLESIDGFIDNERFESRTRPGWILSLSTWRDEKSVIRWRTEARHHLTQEKGRNEIFSDYHLRVGEVTADTAPPNGIALEEHRFDTTETGATKACSIVELTPREGRSLTKGAAALARAVGLEETAPGLVAYDVLNSIYVPGKAVILIGWATDAGARGLRPTMPAEAAIMRHRSVRVIRDYGMYDRRETPQYYPEAKQAG